MPVAKRLNENPFLLPGQESDWDACAAFNPSLVKQNADFHLFYRAQSRQTRHLGELLSLSSIGHSKGTDGIHFKQRRPLLVPDQCWDKFGCEDPRATLINDRFYIFYTALSCFPFEATGIRVGLAICDKHCELIEKHPVTPFNAKAMTLFPEKINNQFAALLTVHTDLPPAKIALALFDDEQQIWSESYWEEWYSNLDSHVIPLLKSHKDHLEVGAAPIKTDKGWLVVYSYITHYFTSDRAFSIEAVLLDLDDPLKVIGRTATPILVPEEEYELVGDVKNVIFPSSALLQEQNLYIYYGAADTSCCAAYLPLQQLLNEMISKKVGSFIVSKSLKQGFYRYSGNPIIMPRAEYSWEAKATFNPAAIYAKGKFHLVYRAMSLNNTSVLGYASSIDGTRIEQRPSSPIYQPRAPFEQKLRPGNSGCEDPRITLMGNILYMFYTAFDGYTPRVAYTQILLDDFVNQRWHWSDPKVITPPGIDDKDACILPKKINGKYIIFHRIDGYICINSVNSLDFGEGHWLRNDDSVISPRKTYWDNKKFGIAAPPLETRFGWLLFFHRISTPGDIYKIEALLLKLDDPKQVIAETDAVLLEPEAEYEKQNQVHNVVFPCGAVLHHEQVYLFYGGADQVVGVATMSLEAIFKRLGL